MKHDREKNNLNLQCVLPQRVIQSFTRHRRLALLSELVDVRLHGKLCAYNRVHVLVRVHVKLRRRHWVECHATYTLRGRADHNYAGGLIRATDWGQLHHAHQTRRFLAQDGRQGRQRQTIGRRSLRSGWKLSDRLAGPIFAPIDGDAERELTLLGFRTFRMACEAAHHKFPRWETYVRVGNIDQTLVAESPPDGVHEDGVRLRMDAISLCEHVEVKSLYVAAIAHLGFPTFIWTFFGSGKRPVLNADFPLCGLEEVRG